MELKRFDRIILKMLYLLVVGIVVTQVFGRSSITSALYVVTFPLTILLWIRSIRKTITGMDFLMLIAVATTVCSVLMNAAINNVDISFSYIKKMLMFLMTLLFFQTVYRFGMDQEITRFLTRITDLLTLFLIAVFFVQPANAYMINGVLTPYLTFGLSNPNLSGLYLMCLYMLALYRLFQKEKWYWKLYHVVISGFLAFFILLTQSRNCLLILVVFTAACAWLIFRSERKLRINATWSLIIAIFPMVFVTLYLMLISNAWIVRTFDFLISEGKDLDSRVNVWSSAYEQLQKAPVFGAYHYTGNMQMHNTHLDMACSYGLPVMILVCVLLGKYLHQGGRYYADKKCYVYILGFACALMLGMGEAALFSGGLGIYVLVGSFLMLSRGEVQMGNSRV